MNGAGRPKGRKITNWIYVYDIDKHTLGHAMYLSGAWQEPVAGVVDNIKDHQFCLFKLPQFFFLLYKQPPASRGTQFTSSIYFRAHIVL